MDIKLISVLIICSFNLSLGRDVEKKLKKLRGDLEEESDSEDEDVVRIQWEGNGNFGKKYSVFSDINSAESGIPLPILEPPFYYYSSSIHDFEREIPKVRGGLEADSREGNSSGSVRKLRIYEITSDVPARTVGKETLGSKSDFEGKQDGNFGKFRLVENYENGGKIGRENSRKWKSDEIFGKFGDGENFGVFKNNENGRQFDESERGNSGKWKNDENFGKFGDGGNFGKVGNFRQWKNDENRRKFSDGKENSGKLKSDENFGKFGQGENFGLMENSENVGKTDENFGKVGNDRNFGLLKNNANVGKSDERKKENFGKWKTGENDSGTLGNRENFEKIKNIGNLGEFDNNDNVRKLKENFEDSDNFARWNSNSGGDSRNFGKTGNNYKDEKFEDERKSSNLSNFEKWEVDNKFSNNENFGKSQDNEKLPKFENPNWKVLRIDENLGNRNNDEKFEHFGNGRNLKVLKLDESFRIFENEKKQNQNTRNFGNNNSLKVLKIDENFGRFPSGNLRNGNLENAKSQNERRLPQILNQQKDQTWLGGIGKLNSNNKNDSGGDDFGNSKKPENFGNHQKEEINNDQNENEETDENSSTKSSVWDPSKILSTTKFRPAQSLTVIKPEPTRTYPRGNRKYQQSSSEEITSERRNSWEFSRDKYLRRKTFQSRVNHFRYLDAHSKFGAIPGVPGIDYPLNTEYQLRVTKKFQCPVHTDTHIYIADRSSRCQVFYVCYGNNSGVQMVCPDGTLFNQQLQVCDWWFNVIC